MNEKIIKLSDKAVSRIKEIMSQAKNSTIGVRVGVKSGGCAGMSYIMEYAKEVKPNEEVIEEKKVNIDMTLTSPNCPVAESLPKMVKNNILKIDGVSDVDLKLVWDPPWTKDKMSEASKLELNL